MDPGMAPVMERFPEHATSIQVRFHADQRFREMCSDYADTLQALQHWQALAARTRRLVSRSTENWLEPWSSKSLQRSGLPPQVGSMI